jgi:hypothetical protein
MQAVSGQSPFVGALLRRFVLTSESNGRTRHFHCVASWPSSGI